ncbi:beta-1,6-N-acetylglucosaminyltransferase [Defluviimonas sp. WL0075]|uniref:Peptide O-xylosyltransferase n=1 Tax=Albidovulum sediminicola TaxID=2984331 RepID=A0ABT2YX01_9RHOB|nr:beta-1,6-N-acetylglucosaminyltransferase [Defluviimonas sp. WL0075]MCV2863350.1 beta-1,6-N-acetylglucosaminyltransferase [Defluviimonas sp. WL0075]
MSVGFVMLCHTALGRAAQVARHWAASGAPVVIHVDARAPRTDIEAMRASCADQPNISFAPRFRCEWGTFGLVRATQAATAQMLARHPDVQHVFLASGSCLPLRPLEELRDYLARHPQTDFIESVTTADVGWTKGGLDAERFTLRFPFSWRRQRRLFDAYTRLQRRIGVRRRIPLGLVPHLGSQWWCLTRATLTRILEDPNRAIYDRYFRRVWIPDESYFQTLARLHSTRIESRPLTLSKFDHAGKPHVFYDDHLQLLRRSDCFVARKIWPGATQLYDAFLSPLGQATRAVEPNPGKIDQLFTKAAERRARGRPGLYMQSRLPRAGAENGRTAGPYSVFHGFSTLFEDFDSWLAKMLGLRVHGHLFAPERAEFAGGDGIFDGALSDSAALRDFNPRSFLTNLLWNSRGERQCFLTGPRDSLGCTGFMAQDANAQISVVTGTWAIPLSRATGDFSAIRAEAARCQKAETEMLGHLQSGGVKASVRVWPLAGFIENPMEAIQAIFDEINPRAPHRLAEVPRMVDLGGVSAFLQQLRNQGMLPTLVGDYAAIDAMLAAPHEHMRPYLVR